METLTFLMTSSFYPPYHLGGDATNVKYLVDELVKRGHEVHVLHSLDAYTLKRKNLPQPIKDTAHIHQIKTPFNYSAYSAYLTGKSPVGRKFEKLIKEIKPDVVHNHNISLLGFDLLKKKADYVNFYTAHDYWLICQQNSLFRNNSSICKSKKCFSCSIHCKKFPQIWRNFGFTKLIPDIDYLISPSDYLAAVLSKSLCRPVLRLPYFVPEPDEENIKQTLHNNYFLYAGVLEKHKGVLDLIAAFTELNPDLTSQLLLAGQGQLTNSIKLIVQNNKLHEKIKLLGWADHSTLYGLLKNANALIIPSIWPENFPLIALEALSVGTPIISSNNGGLPEIVRDFDENLIFETVPELKSILLNFEKKSYDRNKLKKLYAEKYSAQVFIDKYFKLISNVDAKKNRLSNSFTTTQSID